jgi:hypothetical protein
LEDPVADGVGQGGVGHGGVPGVDGELADDEGGASLGSVFDDVEEVVVLEKNRNQCSVTAGLRNWPSKCPAPTVGPRFGPSSTRRSGGGPRT